VHEHRRYEHSGGAQYQRHDHFRQYEIWFVSKYARPACVKICQSKRTSGHNVSTLSILSRAHALVSSNTTDFLSESRGALIVPLLVVRPARPVRPSLTSSKELRDVQAKVRHTRHRAEGVRWLGACSIRCRRGWRRCGRRHGDGVGRASGTRAEGGLDGWLASMRHGGN